MNSARGGKLKAEKKHNGQYDNDEKSVFALVNNGIERLNDIYTRVSTPKQKKDLESQKGGAWVWT